MGRLTAIATYTRYYLAIVPAVVSAAILLSSAALGKVNCKNPSSQTEMNVCAQREFIIADKKLNAVYKKAMASMRRVDCSGAKILRDAQRAWIAYRNKACEAYGFIARGGRMEIGLVTACETDLTRKRTKDLQDFIDLI